MNPDKKDTPDKPSATVDRLSPTIFHEPWWLEITGCSVVEVESGGKAVGRLPYLLTRRMGVKFIATPTLTHFLGPAVDEGEGNPNTRFLKRRSITRELIEKLPPASMIKIKCHRNITEVIAFQEENFRTSIQFTCEVHPESEEVLWKNLRDKTRNVIRRAQEELVVEMPSDTEEYLSFYKKNLDTRDIESHMDLAICSNLIRACLERKRGRIYLARDKNGLPVAGIFCAWDATASYYLMSMGDPQARNGAVSLLIWAAIKDAASRNIIFDFDGLNNKGSALFFSGFSANMKPRYIATHASNLFMQFAWDWRDARSEGSYFH